MAEQRSWTSAGRQDVADGREQWPFVEAIHPFERDLFHGFRGSPRSPTVAHLSLVNTVDGLNQSVAVIVANTPGRWFDPGLGKALGKLDRHVLAVPSL